MTHTIKIQKEYADAVYLGEKTFEVRHNDRGYKKGDLVVFRTLDEAQNYISHPLRTKIYVITYVLDSFIGLAPNYVAFAIKDVTKDKRIR